jgi:ABC-type sugar transport system ATPase subunit
MKLEINVPNIAHVVVTGPTQCGKSIVLERIAQVLRDEFGAGMVNLEAQKNAPPELDKLQSWERDMVRKTTWVLSEV